MLERRKTLGVLAFGTALAAQVTAIYLPTFALAESAADALMGALQPSTSSASQSTTQPGAATHASSVKLSDPFLMQFFAAWQTEKNLPFELNDWASKVVQQRFAEAAHLWTVVQAKSPDSFIATAQATQLYLYYRLGLAQTFVDRLLIVSQNAAWADSRAMIALAQTLGQGLDRWLLDNHVSLTSAQEAVIAALPRRSMLESTLKGWASIRKGETGLAALEGLPAESLFKIQLGQTVALGLARKGDLAGAAGILKKHVEPALEAKKDVRELGSHYLQIARLLYQAGALDGSETYYLKVPSGSADFYEAQEELTWIWLRKGDVARLRGALTTLSSKYFDDRFAPEAHLVRAISNLKLCYFEEAKKDFDLFVASNRGWAGKITAAIQAEHPPTPLSADLFSREAEVRIAQRENEAAKLDILGKESITATLPAVGPQRHWTEARDGVLAGIEGLKKYRDSEYRRQWKNDKLALEEAIRKMRFVKVELLSQVRMLSRAASTGSSGDEIRLTSAKSETAPARLPEGDMRFPFDGVLWPDELFKLYSTAQGRCLQQVRGVQ